MVSLAQEGDVFVVQVEGDLNHQAAERLRADAQTAMDNDACDFVVNFAECTGIDSSGLEVLTWLDRNCRENLGMCKLCMLTDTIETILAITRLDKQLEVCGTPDEAFAAMKSA